MMIYMLRIVIFKEKKGRMLDIFFCNEKPNINQILVFSFVEDFKFSVDSEIFKVCSF
jgi:hypothetical protein